MYAHLQITQIVKGGVLRVLQKVLREGSTVPKESLNTLFQNFHLLLPDSLELNCIKSNFFHLYFHIVTHNFQVKKQMIQISENYFKIQN